MIKFWEDDEVLKSINETATSIVAYDLWKKKIHTRQLLVLSRCGKCIMSKVFSFVIESGWKLIIVSNVKKKSKRDLFLLFIILKL